MGIHKSKTAIGREHRFCACICDFMCGAVRRFRAGGGTPYQVYVLLVFCLLALSNEFQAEDLSDKAPTAPTYDEDLRTQHGHAMAPVLLFVFWLCIVAIMPAW